MPSPDERPTIQLPVPFLLPGMPNFLRAEGITKDVSDCTDDELRTIGALWTEALVAHAAKRRKNRLLLEGFASGRDST